MAWHQGLRLGIDCCYCCANLTTIFLVIGVMYLRAMAVVTAAITAERVAPGGRHVNGAVGLVVLEAGAFLMARAISFG